MTILITVAFLVLTLWSRNSYSSSTPCDENQKIIEVVEDDIEDDIMECQLKESVRRCPNLTMAFQYVDNNTCIRVSKSENRLSTSPQSVSNVYNFTITSYAGANVTCSHPNVGISILDSQNINISGIIFHSCGTEFTVQEYPVPQKQVNISATLYFRGTHNLRVDQVNVTDHVGYAIAIIDSGGDFTSVHVVNVNKSRNSCGLFLLYTGMTPKSIRNKLLIRNSTFHGLTTKNKSAREDFTTNITQEFDYVDLPHGKGAALSLFVFDNSKDNVLEIINCQYIGNQAKWGGSMYVYYGKNTIKNIVSIKSTRFVENVVDRSGGGIFFDDQSKAVSNNSMLISDGIFQWNRASNGGGSGIYTISAVITFRGRTVFTENNGSSIVASGSVLDVYDELLFTGNTGKNGAAIYLYKCSSITLHSATNLTFHNNSVTEQGGALYIYHRFIKTATKCFFQYARNTSRSSFSGVVKFSSNKAKETGNHIYASTFTLCDQGENITTWPNFVFLPADSTRGLGSAVKKIYVSTGDFLGHSLDTYFTPKVSLFNEFGANATSLVSLQALECTGSKKSFSCTQCNFTVSGNEFMISVSNNESTVKYIGNHGDCDFTVSAVSEMGVVSKKIKNLQVKPCLPFFDHIQGSCKCNVSNTKAECIDEMVYIPPNYWVSNVSKQVVECPDTYCNPCDDRKDKMYIHLCRYIINRQCSENRDESSRLCSRCKTNFSVGLNGKKCVKCQEKKNSAIVVVVGEIITVLVLQFAMILLNYNYYASYLIPIVYFYQLVPFFLTADTKLNKLNKFDEVLFAFTNSEGLDVRGRCFVNGLDGLSKLWYQFGCGVLWLIIYVVLYLVTRLRRVRRFGNAWIRLGPTVAITSFLDIISFCCKSLNWVEIDGDCYVFVFADEPYFSKRHKRLFLIAIFSIVFMFVGVVYLFFKLRRRPGLFNVFDLHDDRGANDGDAQHCMRHWIYPLYFLFIGAFVAVGVVRAADDRSLILLLILLTFVCVYSIIMPYRNNKCNLFELIVLSDMLIIGAITDSLTTQDETAPMAINWIIIIPFVGLVLWILYMILCTFFAFTQIKFFCYTKERKNRASTPPRVLH